MIGHVKEAEPVGGRNGLQLQDDLARRIAPVLRGGMGRKKRLASGHRAPPSTLVRIGSIRSTITDNAFRIRMHAICLIQGGIGDDTIEEKGIQGHLMLLREIGKDAIEFLGVFRPEIGRRLHADEKHMRARMFESAR